jgi:dipeptidyl aminopeptidase/acylaminoacyl peptidase
MLKRAISFASLLLAVASVHPAFGQGAKRMTFDDVLALKSVSDAQMSPDGRWVAYVVSHADMQQNAADPDVYVVAASGGDPIRLTTSKKADTQPRWSPDGKWIAFLSAREERAQVYLISPSGGEAEKLTESKTDITEFQWSPDGRRIAYVAPQEPTADEEKKQRDKDDAVVIDQNYRFTRIWTIDVATKKAAQVIGGAFQASDPQWSPDGKLIAYVAHPTPKADDGPLSDIWVAGSDGSTPRRLVFNDGPDESPRWSPDGKWIAYSTRAGKTTTEVGQTQLAIISAGGGTPRMVAQVFLYQPGPATWSGDGATIYFAAGVRTTTHLFSVASAGGTPRQLSSAPGVMSSFSFSRDRSAIAFTFEDMQHPSDIHVASTAGAFVPTRRTDHNPQVRELALGRSEVVRWKSKDGMEVEGILLYPVDFQPGRRYPTVAEIHGGPAGDWTERFPGWSTSAHVWAGRGWAMFFPNPRGSTGYGEKFLRANIKDWGVGDYRDIQTGIDNLIAKGIADSSKLAQSGWSYGGYMTAWTLTQTNRFKAVMVGAGLTNMASMYGTNDIPRTIDEYFGAEPWNDPAQYSARSAMTFIKQARTPTLIQHGQADQRVPVGQSQELYVGLKKNNVPVELVFYPREPHGLREPRHQLDKIRREYAWFAKYVLGESPDAPKVVP